MEILVEIGIIIIIATLIAGLMKLLKQPLIIGYIIAGIIVGPYVFNIIKSTEIISIFSRA